MMKAPTQFTSIGGQAVIEGVMMRSPHFIAVAVRKPNRQIIIRNKPYSGISSRFPFLRKPILRGVATLIESMSQGIDALSYAGQMAMEEEQEAQETSSWAITLSMIVAFLFGMGLFVVLPHFLTALLTTPSSPLFHLLDGVLKMIILLSYMYLIALMKDIHRVFQYHGAEHKTIYAFEAGEDLTVENAKKYTTLHPRCGTSFLLFLVLISILVFSVIFPVLHLTNLSSVPFLNHVFMVLMKILLMFPVAGLSYEFIKLSAAHLDHPFFRAVVWPGMLLQKLTTREPTDDQLEVALASLRQVLLAEGAPTRSTETNEIEISGLMDLGTVQASVAQFPEL